MGYEPLYNTEYLEPENGIEFYADFSFELQNEIEAGGLNLRISSVGQTALSGVSITATRLVNCEPIGIIGVVVYAKPDLTIDTLSGENYPLTIELPVGNYLFSISAAGYTAVEFTSSSNIYFPDIEISLSPAGSS